MLPWNNWDSRPVLVQLDQLFLPLYACFASIIIACMYFIFFPPSYLIIELFACIGFYISNSDDFIGKSEKLKSLLIFYLGGILTYPGVTIISILPNALIVYIFCLSFILFATSIIKQAYAGMASVCAMFAVEQIYLTETPGSLHEAYNLWMALNVSYLVLAILTLLYPERYHQRIGLIIDKAVQALNNALTVKNKPEFYCCIDELSLHFHQLERFGNASGNRKVIELAAIIREMLLTINYLRQVKFDDESLKRLQIEEAIPKINQNDKPLDLSDIGKARLREQIQAFKALRAVLYE